jgi:sialate O-acetylesterase
MRSAILLICAVTAAASPVPDIFVMDELSAPVTAPPPAFRFAQALGDNMILQSAPNQAMVWGWSEQGASVTVNFNGKDIAATTGAFRDAPYTWKVLLPASAASFDPVTITATSGSTTISIVNATFGDVWVCSGQSNVL